MRMFTNALLVAAAATLLTAGTASAGSLTFQLTSDHCTGSGGCIAIDGASAGTVVVTEVAGGLSFSVTLNSGYSFVDTGFNVDFGFNLNGNPSITYSGVSSGFAAGNTSGNTTTLTNPQTAGVFHMDGAGDFEYGLLCTACGNGGSNPQPGPLNFTISAAGLNLSSLQLNAAGEYFAVDLLGNGNTGAVDASLSTVPDGGTTVGLLGLSMLGLGYLRRRIS